MTNAVGPPVLSLAGRSALVTGGGTGIGKACATALAAAGARVTICGPDGAVLDAACAALGAQGLPEGRAVTVDVTDENQVAAAVDAAAVDGALDIAVANAGTAFPGSLLHIGAEHWMVPVGVNVLGTAHTIKHAGQRMKEGGGSIISLGSISWHLGLPDLVLYQTSKAAIEGLTRSLARDLGPDNIRVNCVVPGNVKTPRQEQWYTPEGEAEIVKAQCIPHRLVPEDVAALVVFLASDDARGMTGHEYFVDAGWR